MNHHEWYISKKPSALYSFILAGLIWARYSSGGIPWGMTVPMIEMTASEISRNMVSFSEQKKSQRECRKSFFGVVTCTFSLKSVLPSPFKRKNCRVPGRSSMIYLLFQMDCCNGLLNGWLFSSVSDEILRGDKNGSVHLGK